MYIVKNTIKVKNGTSLNVKIYFKDNFKLLKQYKFDKL